MPVDALRSLRDQLLELSPELFHVTGPDGGSTASSSRFFTTKPDGKGLGLSTVLGIAKGLSGFVQVDTVPGRGTRVSAWFPVQVVDVSRAATER